MKIYFAGSIRGGRADQEIYADIISLLKKYGEVLTEHVGSPEVLSIGELHLSDKQIFERDSNYMEECEAVIAEVTTPSLGVGYEIGRMEGKKPILCFFRTQEGKRLSAMFAGNDKLKIVSYGSLSDIETALKEFFDNL
jgi:nucleoside 2-deoxyribosyltransferase